MKILVNAVSIREGGPLVVFRNLLEGMRALRPGHLWMVAGPTLDGNAVAPIQGLIGESNPAELLGWYEMGLPAAVGRLRPDVVFSMTNYLPVRPLDRPTVLLEQHAGHFSNVFDRLERAASRSARERLLWRYKSGWVRRSVRRATTLLVQTEALASAVVARGLRERTGIAVVPHGPGQVRQRERASLAPSNRPWRVGYPVKYGVQKNFETLFLAVKSLSASRDIKLVLTLDRGYAPAADVLRRAEALGVARLIENEGEFGSEKIEALYDSLDVMAFCSLAESFGFPMVEAMARGLPIVVADTPENREITGKAGLVFPALDAAALAAQLARLMDDAAEWQRRSELSLARGRQFSWARASRDTLAVLETTAGALT